VPDRRIELQSQLSTEESAAVLRLIAATADRDGRNPLSERMLLQVRYAGAPTTRHLMLWSAEDLHGYAQFDTALAIAELAAVDPTSTRALVDALFSNAGDSLQIWAHGESAASAPVLRDLGLVTKRTLLQLRRSLIDPPLDPPAWPPGVSVRTFVPGQDEVAWLEVNNAAFADHPEQSNWSLADITVREHEPWFDPDGFFLAIHDDAVVGFHWTKVHEPEAGERDRIGEVYVVGVAPSMQGQRLGSALTLVGMHHLAGVGLDTVMLYVDESNHAAVTVYERLGFVRWDSDICFGR
jgi:mycothiol synthase